MVFVTKSERERIGFGDLWKRVIDLQEEWVSWRLRNISVYKKKIGFLMFVIEICVGGLTACL